MFRSFMILCGISLLTASAAAQPSPVVIYDTMTNMNAILGAANMDGDVAEEIVVLDSANERLQIIDSATGAIDFDSDTWGWNYIYPPGYEHQGDFNTAWGSNHGYDIFCDKDGDGIMEVMVLVSTGTIYEQQLAIISLNGGALATPEPGAFRSDLGAARPNPFGPSTSISYTMQAEGPARIRIYDVTGRLVRTLVNERRPAGRHTVAWDGTDDEGHAVAGGTYFYELAAEGRSEARKAILLK
jgi:hypothetical protein